MDSISTLLRQKNFDEPSEIEQIKKYVLREYKTKVGVQVRDKDIVLSVPSAALANTLRLKGPEIKKLYDIEKKLTFRITG